jgi:hypothetical protein
MDVCFLCLYVVLSCVGRGLCDGLITPPEESYRVSNCMCDHRNPQKGPYVQSWKRKENDEHVEGVTEQILQMNRIRGKDIQGK